jgi:pimeloyl-ACP methyl ester carboxylesterase
MPVLVLSGAQGLLAGLPVPQIWGQYAEQLRAEVIDDCGHFLAEEQPTTVAEQLLDFLAS